MINASEVIGLNDRLVAFYPDQHLVAVIQSVAGNTRSIPRLTSSPDLSTESG